MPTFMLILIPLAVTVVLERIVANMLFELEGRDLHPVVAVNLLTNPVINAVFLTLWGLGVGMSKTFVEVPGAPGRGGDYTTAVESWVYLALALAEVVVVIVEWRLLVWAFAGRAGGSLRVLALSFVMNAVSGSLSMLMPLATSVLLLFSVVLSLPALVAFVIVGLVLTARRIARRARSRPSSDPWE